jgi:DNA-binding NarL/FixJ family response regulator
MAPALIAGHRHLNKMNTSQTMTREALRPINAERGRRKVLLVDDHPVVREGLTKRINTEQDLTVCADVKSAAEALEAIDRFQPDVIVVDLALAQGHGLELIKEVRSQRNRVPILVFSMYDETSYALRALKAGAQGYLTKHESAESLLSALRTVLNGEYAVTAEVSKIFFESLRPSANRFGPADSLGDRELEVFELMGKGICTRQIALLLHRSVKTVETYQARIKRKFNLKNSSELMREAVRWVEQRR